MKISIYPTYYETSSIQYYNHEIWKDNTIGLMIIDNKIKKK